MIIEVSKLATQSEIYKLEILCWFFVESEK